MNETLENAIKHLAKYLEQDGETPEDAEQLAMNILFTRKTNLNYEECQ